MLIVTLCEKYENGAKEATLVTETCDGTDLVVLQEVSLIINPGELVAVVGPVAAGKSTLLLSLLSAVKRLSGSLRFNGSMAFVPQEPFLLNDTIKNNVTFGLVLGFGVRVTFQVGLDFDELLFAQAMRISQLDQDLAEFPGREDTEIGERGINLSGGQKQRVSIARAVYAQSDILVADDCLSALDAYVGKRVFEQVICGSFAGKTRIFVTHQLHYLEDERVDRVVFLKEGRVQANGSYKQLMESDAHTYKMKTTNKSSKSLCWIAQFRDFVTSSQKAESNPISSDGTGHRKAANHKAFSELFEVPEIPEEREYPATQLYPIDIESIATKKAQIARELIV